MNCRLEFYEDFSRRLGDNQDVRFESSKALTWSCVAKACVYPWITFVMWEASKVGATIHWKCVLVGEWQRSNLCICHTTLLCLVVWMLLRVAFVHTKGRWRHVSFSCG